ncbi:MAG TPA: DPP IV N-terminal domain-containing protein [Chthoniobacterales bacterium]|nr:DPP IV N-terminal domain-containing protein [Chthoniobacterales bacterium]
MRLPADFRLGRFALACIPWTFLAGFAGAAEPEPADLRYFRELVETRNYSLGQPVSPQFTPDGKAVVFLRGGARDPVLRLYEFTIADSKLREILTPEKLLRGAEETLTAEERSRRERARQSLRGFTSFELSKDGSKLLVALSSKLSVITRADSRVIELPGESWIDPHFSPDGRAVAAVKGGELHVIELETGADVAVTSGATETLQHGVAEFVAQEEMGRHEGFWWSPDSQWLAYQETDNSGVESRFIADPLHPEATPARNFYPRAGTNNARVRLGLVARSRGATRWVEWDRENYPYLARVIWKETGAPLCVLVQNRAQQDEILLAVDPQSGATRELLREKDAAWLNLDRKPMPVWLKNGREFLWTTERNGTWQIELHSADGALLRPITPTTFGFDQLIDLNEAERSIVVAGGPDPRERHLFRFALDQPGEGRRLTSERGRHDAVFGEAKENFLHRFDLLDGRAGWELLRSSDGGKLGMLPSVAERPSSLPAVELTRTAGPRPMDAAIVRPGDFNKAGRYPVILDVYAGPSHKQVLAQPDRYMIDQWMANRGYIVVAIDGRGTPGHGREWERAIRGNLIDAALADQIAGLQALAKHEPAMDLKRVGVVGWSFGGYFSAMAVMRKPEIFQCGIIGAPVVTWENYDTHYTERYLGLPSQNAEGYRVSNVLTYTSELLRPILLIHGLTDDNVYAQHSMQLSDALFTAGKPFNFLPLLGTHMLSDPLLRLRRQTRIVEFFDGVLKKERSIDSQAPPR